MKSRLSIVRRELSNRVRYGGKKTIPALKPEGVRKKVLGEAPDEHVFTCDAISQDGNLLMSAKDDKIVLERRAVEMLSEYHHLYDLAVQGIGLEQDLNDLRKRHNELHRHANELQNENRQQSTALLKRDIEIAQLKAELLRIAKSELGGTPITFETDKMLLKIELK